MRNNHAFGWTAVKLLAVVLALGLILVGGTIYMRQQKGRGALTFDGQRAYEYALAQCARGPRPSGSAAGWATGDYIIEQLEKAGWETTTQEFDYRGVRIRNIVGRGGKGPPIILGAHYDTRRLADQDPQDPSQPVPGGNDGASGVAVLLELAHIFSQKSLHNEVWLAFFDAEDNGRLDGWSWSVGATYMAEHLTIQPEAVIVVDMVGDADQQLYWERNSDRELMEQLWDVAAELGYSEQFIPQYKWSMMDDHAPFLQRGIPAVDIIDFDYPYWHTVEDTCDKVSPESLERVGRVLEKWLKGE
jgi:glutaminyl-peptide cyclotransferase